MADWVEYYPVEDRRQKRKVFVLRDRKISLEPDQEYMFRACVDGSCTPWQKKKTGREGSWTVIFNADGSYGDTWL